MFTGIIESQAPIVAKTETTLSVAKPESFVDLTIGASIAVSGVCLSVVEFDDDTVTFDVVPETWAKTNLGQLAEGSTVNLERAMVASGRLDGHLVQGHVEGIGECIGFEENVVTLRLPAILSKLCVHKGSVTINGVSLTVANVEAGHISIALVPHTLENTNLGAVQPGDLLNIETDIIGRYVYAFTHEDR